MSRSHLHVAPVMALTERSVLPCQPDRSLLCISECAGEALEGGFKMTSYLAGHNVLLLYNTEQTLKRSV